MEATGREVSGEAAVEPHPKRSWVTAPSAQVPLPFLAEVPVQPGSIPSLAEALRAVPDHRKPRGFKAHQPPVPLVPTFLLLLVALMCGRRGYEAIAEWARTCNKAHPEVIDALGFAPDRHPRTPVAATFFRLLRDCQLRAFQVALQGWLEAAARAVCVTLPARERLAVPGDQIGLDGKAVRGASARRERGKDGEGVLYLVSAYAPALNTVLDQVPTEGRGRELAAVLLLLGQLSLEGRVITADAASTQREVCEKVKGGKGDYLLPVKENQPSLLKDIQWAFSPSGSAGAEDRVADGSGADRRERDSDQARAPGAEGGACGPQCRAGVGSRDPG